MATEEYKIAVEQLFINYVDLRKMMEKDGYQNVSLSFKDYLDFYSKFVVEDLGDYDDEEYEDEDEDSESEDNSE